MFKGGTFGAWLQKMFMLWGQKAKKSCITKISNKKKKGSDGEKMK